MSDPLQQELRGLEAAFEVPGVPASRVRIDVAGLSDIGRVRETNEDAYLVYRAGRYIERIASNVPETMLPTRLENSGTLMIVADGLGGREAGDVASRAALMTMLQQILRSSHWALKLDDPKTREQEIRDLAKRVRGYLSTIHTTLREQAAGDPRLTGMSTTFTGAWSLGVDLFTMHIGDSKAYLLHRGAIHRITHDHTVAQEFADRGLIKQDEVPTHGMHHVLTRAVGGPSEKVDFDLHYERITHGDRLLLCSDGMTAMATESEIAATLSAHPASDDACRALVDLALERGGRDNVTVVVAGYAIS